MGCSCRTFRNEPFAKGPQDLRADKKKTPLGAGQVPCSAYVRTARGFGGIGKPSSPPWVELIWGPRPYRCDCHHKKCVSAR